MNFGSGSVSFSPMDDQTSSRASPGCLALIFGWFLIFGLFFMGFFAKMAWTDFRVHTVYRQATCTILDKRLKEKPGKGSSTYALEFTFKYEVKDKEYTSTGYDSSGLTTSGRQEKESILARYEIGQTYPCWYDPDRPERAVLVRSITWVYLFAFLPLTCIVIGVKGILWAIRN